MVMPHMIIKNIEAITKSPNRNPAVNDCCLAAQRALAAAQEIDPENTLEAVWDCTTAYRESMPNLDGYENIRDYVACVAHGMLLGVIDPLEGPKFLYAAQIALSVLPRRPKRIKRNTIIPKTQTPPPSPTVAP